MALIQVYPTVGTAATQLLTIQQSTRPQTAVKIFNSSTSGLYIGGPSVNASTMVGHAIAPASSETFYLSGGDVVYGSGAYDFNVTITYSA